MVWEKYIYLEIDRSNVFDHLGSILKAEIIQSKY